MYPAAGSKSQPGALPADLLEELDPLAARKSVAHAAPMAHVSHGGGLLLPPPPPSKPKPSLVGSRGPATASAAAGAAATVSARPSTATDRGVVSYTHLLDEVLLPLPPSQPQAVMPSGTPAIQPITSEQTGGKPAAAGVQRPANKPTVIRPKGRPLAPVAAVGVAAAAVPTAAPAAVQPSITTAEASQDLQNSLASRVAGPRRPAPPRPAKPPPPRPTKGPSKQATSRAPSSLPPSSTASNGLYTSRSLADLEGLVVVNPSAPPAVTTRATVDDIAVFPGTAGGWPQLPPRPAAGHPLYHYMISEPHAVALYDYSATQADELSFKEGDIIMLKRRVTNDWLCGTVDRREGIFPASFVAVKKDLPPTKDHVDAAVTGPRCVARFDFEAEQDGDLGFIEGEIIQLVERIGLEWFKGIKRGKTGCFPAAFVEVLEDLPQDKHRKEGYGLTSPEEDTAATIAASGATAAMTASFSIDPNLAIATYDFSGRDESELTLKSGDCVYVLGQWTEDWLYGEANGTCGLFPTQFIDHIPPDLPPWSGDANLATAAASDNAAAAGSTAAPDDEMCVALYDFEAQADGDLTIVAGDRIRILSHSSAEWWEGQLGSRTGIFPSAFVQRL